jgi:hypothetical protein
MSRNVYSNDKVNGLNDSNPLHHHQYFRSTSSSLHRVKSSPPPSSSLHRPGKKQGKRSHPLHCRDRRLQHHQQHKVNGLILSIAVIVVYIIALDLYVGSLDQEEIADAVMAEMKNYDLCESIFTKAPHSLDAFDVKDRCSPTTRNLLRARTIAFICVVLAENSRAYTSRSFDKPFFVEMCSNSAMQYAILMAQCALW